MKQNTPSKRFQGVKGIEKNLAAELQAVLLGAFDYCFVEFWKGATERGRRAR